MTNIPQFARQRMQAQPVGEHPDAGVLTAFSEHSLGAAERESVLAHLAACAMCREIVALALPENAVEEVTPAVQSWFRWPVLRWAAVAASAVIVWAAVLVLVPHTSNHDVSAPVFSMQKVQSVPEVTPNSVAPAAKLTPPADKEQDRVSAYIASPKRASNAPKQMIARDAAPEQTEPLGQFAKLQAPPASRANEVQAKSAPHPAPPAAQLAEKKSDNFQARAADAMTSGGAVDAKRESELRALPAQSQAAIGGPIRKDSATATIAGTITDATGAVVPNALVKVTNAQTNTSTAVHADAAGAYRTPLAPGVYSVEATSPGMQPVLAKDITIDGTVAKNFTLSPAAAAETVEVAGQAAPVPAPPPEPASAAPMANKAGAMKAKAVTDQPFSGLAGAKAGQLPVTSWRVGEDGSLERSGDGSAWHKVDLSPGLTFRVVLSADGAVWAGGTDGALFHGANQGQTWHRVPVGPKNAPVSDAITAISAPNSKSVIVTTSTGEQWSSKDAGRTWKRLNPQH